MSTHSVASRMIAVNERLLAERDALRADNGRLREALEVARREVGTAMLWTTTGGECAHALWAAQDTLDAALTEGEA